MGTHSVHMVENQPIATRSLKSNMENIPEITINGESAKPLKVIQELNSNSPDNLFIDIQHEGSTVYVLLDKLNYTGKIIFVNAIDDNTSRAFDLNSLDYVLKSNSKELPETAVEGIKCTTKNPTNKAKSKISFNYSDRIMVFDKNQIRFILLNSILVISAARDYSVVETTDGKKILVMRSMADWMERLPQEHFIRIHRSYIVNLNHIEKIIRYSTSSAKVFLKNHSEPINISRNFYKDLKNKFM